MDGFSASLKAHFDRFADNTYILGSPIKGRKLNLTENLLQKNSEHTNFFDNTVITVMLL